MPQNKTQNHRIKLNSTLCLFAFSCFRWQFSRSLVQHWCYRWTEQQVPGCCGSSDSPFSPVLPPQHSSGSPYYSNYFSTNSRSAVSLPGKCRWSLRTSSRCSRQFWLKARNTRFPVPEPFSFLIIYWFVSPRDRFYCRSERQSHPLHFYFHCTDVAMTRHCWARLCLSHRLQWERI